MRRVLLVFDYARRDKPSTSAHAKHFLSRLPNRLGDDIRIPRVQDTHAGHSVISTARRTQVHVVTGVMVHAGFRQHGVVFDFGFTQRRHVVRDENEFSFPRADGFENRLVPKLFYVKEQKKNKRVSAKSGCGKKSKRGEREKNERTRGRQNLAPWTLREKRERKRSKTNQTYRVLPGSHHNLQTVVDTFLRFLR